MPFKSGQGSNSKATQSKSAISNKVPPRSDQEVISVSSSSHKSHISISSGDSSSVLVLSSPLAPKRHRTRTIVDAVEIVSPRRNSRVPQFAAPSNLELKHSRSPSIQYMGSSQHPAAKSAPAPKPLKRKKKFESDSDISPGDSIVMVRPARATTSAAPISLRPSAMKLASTTHRPLGSKKKIASPCKFSSKHSPKKARFDEQEQGAELVPSSQSDEQELAALKPIKKDPEDIKESVNKWRQEAAPPGSSSPVHGDWDLDMDVDADMPLVPDMDIQFSSHGDPGNPISAPVINSSPYLSSEAEVQAGLLHRSSANTSTDRKAPPSLFDSTSTRPITPPLGGTSTVLPVTPVALDAAAKTAQIIAQIKKNALVASLSSPDEADRVLEYKELEDSSSEEESDGLDIFTFNRVVKGKGKR